MFANEIYVLEDNRKNSVPLGMLQTLRRTEFFPRRSYLNEAWEKKQPEYSQVNSLGQEHLKEQLPDHNFYVWHYGTVSKQKHMPVNFVL